MPSQLPPGPGAPATMQTINWQVRPISFLERCRARFGKRFTIRLLTAPPFVMVADPDAAKQVFTAPPDVLHPGEGARILEPVLGKNSVILLDEDGHLEQRKLMLPAFHGERMKRLTGLMTEVAEREVDRWPKDQVVDLHPRFQALTLEVILRTVIGLDPGPRLDAVRERITQLAENVTGPFTGVDWLQSRWNPRWREFMRLRDEVDELLFELVDERRAEGADRPDVLSMLLEARHEDDGSPMSNQELRDELMTLLVAGHETTASELAWAMTTLSREPRVVERLTQEIDAGDDDAYLTATINETLRRRPVLPNAAPRAVVKPIEVGGWTYEPREEGLALVVNSYLIHHDPVIYPEPYAFRPERFLDESPGTYTWTPFGGGRRRCLGASFAQLEMKVILRALLERSVPKPGTDGVEVARRRAITIAPRQASPTVLRPRTAAPAGPAGPGSQPAAPEREPAAA